MFVFAEDSLRLLAVNTAMTRLYGWSREELLRLKATDLRPAEEIPRFRAALEAQRGAKAAHVGQWRHRRKDGSCFDVEVTVSCVEFQGRKARLVLVSDITSRKQAEAALQQERTLLRTLIDHLPDCVYVKDRQHRFIMANRATAGLMGVSSPEQLIGRTDLDLYAAEQARQYWADEEFLLATGEPLLGKEEPHTDGVGNRLEMLTSKLPFRNAEGEVVGLVGVSRDVTERKRAEVALRESEERFRRLFEEHGAAMLLIAADTGVIVDANPAAATFYGYSRAKLRSMRIDQINQLPAEEIALEQQRAVRRIQNCFVVPHRLANGQGRLIEEFSSPIRIQDRLLLFSIMHDITEQRRVEEALRSSEELVRATLQALPANIAVIDTHGRILAVNQSWVDFATSQGAAGSSKVAVGSNYLEVCRRAATQEADARQALAGLEEVLRGSAPRFDMEYPCDSPSEQRWFSMTVVPLLAGNGAGAVITHFNITERKRVEEALRESEQRYRVVADFTYDWEFWLGPDGRYRYVSPSAERILGARIGLDVPSEEAVKAVTHPDDTAMRLEHLQAEMVDHPPFEMEFRIVRPDGEVRWMHHVCQAMYDGEGRFLGTRGSNRDITGRKHAEEALHALNATLEQQVVERTRALAESEQRLRAIVDTAADGIITLDAKGRIESMNPAALRLFGYEPAEIIGQNIGQLLAVLGRSQPFDVKTHQAHEGRSQVLGHVSEMSGRTKAGKVIELELILTPLAREGRRGYVAMVHDITQRKRLERELAEVSERERQQVGRELHDELGQILHGVHFLASDLEVRLKRQGVPEARELGRMTHFLDEALETTRSLARGLQPVPPVPEGLMSALREQAMRVRKVYGVRCRFLCPSPVFVSDPTVATHLFRIAQEAVTNAVKHSRCRSVLIRLKATPERLLLGVQDDGHGRIPSVGRRSGMGLHVMQFRASTINGSLVVQRRTKGGTEVICTVEPASHQHLDLSPSPSEP
jgi:PAS domain S-box-containing protein